MFINYSKFDPAVQMALTASSEELACPFYIDLCLMTNNYYDNNQQTEERHGNFFDMLKAGVKFPFQDGNFFYQPEDDSFRIAHAHHLLMEEVSALIDDKDRQYLAYMMNAIVNGALPMFAQIVTSMAAQSSSRFSGYIQEANRALNGCRTGLVVSLVDGKVLLHAYHGRVAIAIDVNEMKAQLVPISTEWDGQVTVLEGDVISPNIDDLMERLAGDCVRRAILWYEDNFMKNGGRVYEEAA